MKKRLSIASYLIYLTLIVWSLLRVHPGLLTRLNYEPKAITEAGIWNVVRFDSKTPADSQSRFVYRGDVSRRATFQIAGPLTELKSVWRSAEINVGIHDASKASVSADDHGLYIGDDTSRFRAYDPLGQPLWSIFVGDSNRGIHSTAALDSHAVYLGSYRGTLYRINKSSGKIEWMRIVGDTIGASPLLLDDHLIVNVETTQPDGYLLKLNKNTGEIIWRTPVLGEQSHASPSYDPISKLIVVGVNNSTLQAFDEKTGLRAWTRTIAGASKSTIAIENGVGFVTDWGRELLAFRVADGAILWRAPLSAKSQVSPVVVDDVVVAADVSGRLIGVDRKTGRGLWRLPFQNPGQKSSPVVINSKIFFHCEKNSFCLISSRGKIEKTWQVGGLFTGSPTVQGNSIYVAYDLGEVERFDF